mmetsp:Transcript_71684/g.202685  ORF Transcript_71684/g.202685 Transcript_71684/m.202685 type:complete len:138 (-) Transcript_71684:490-903(-)
MKSQLLKLTVATVAPAAAVGCSLSVLHYTTPSAHNQHRTGVAERAVPPHANSDMVTLARREVASAPASLASERERDFSGPMGRVELVRTASAAHRLQAPPSKPSSTRRVNRSEAHAEERAFRVSARRHCGALLLGLF